MADDSISAVGGIYKIVNTTNGKVYVGSTKNLRVRCRSHFGLLGRGMHYCKHLQADWNKHGSDAFKFCVIELVQDQRLLVSVEQQYLDEYQSAKPAFGYNKSSVAGSTLGIPCSEEKKKKIGAANSGRKLTAEHIEKISLGLTGKRPSEETLKKLSDASKKKMLRPDFRERIRNMGLNNKGKVLSDEHKAKISSGLLNSKGNKDLARSRRRFTNAQIREMARLRRSGKTYKEIADVFNAHFMSIFKWIKLEKENPNGFID